MCCPNTGADVGGTLEQVTAQYGLSKSIRVDRGPEGQRGVPQLKLGRIISERRYHLFIVSVPAAGGYCGPIGVYMRARGRLFVGID